MNAILGVSRPGDFGADMQHFNPHKTFSGPHGGGGPGAGPICVTEKLAAYLPSPVVEKVERSSERARYTLQNLPKSIGRVRSFFGNVGVLVRAYCYLRSHGPDGLRRVSEQAVLNANYLLAKVKHCLPVPQGDRCMHEFVASAQTLKTERGVTAMDIAKRLLDYGYHAPTVYFPMDRERGDHDRTDRDREQGNARRLCRDALPGRRRRRQAMLHDAPHTTAISRPDEVAAARKPTLCYCE